jgi:hypothetical protein
MAGRGETPPLSSNEKNRLVEYLETEVGIGGSGTAISLANDYPSAEDQELFEIGKGVRTSINRPGGTSSVTFQNATGNKQGQLGLSLELASSFLAFDFSNSDIWEPGETSIVIEDITIPDGSEIDLTLSSFSAGTGKPIGAISNSGESTEPEITENMSFSVPETLEDGGGTKFTPTGFVLQSSGVITFNDMLIDVTKAIGGSISPGEVPEQPQ